MRCDNVIYDHKPEKVLVEKICEGTQQNGLRRVVMRSRIHKETWAERDQEYTVYIADEVDFLTSEPLTATAVEQHFDDWWAYGCQHDGEKPTSLSLEDRLAAAEDALAYLLMKGGLS